MSSKCVTEVYTAEYNWYNQASDQTITAVLNALKRMIETGATPINPNIFGGLIALGVIAKTRTPQQAIELIEAMA